MTLAELLVAVRDRAAGAPAMPPPATFASALHTLTGLGVDRSHEGFALKKILAALAQPDMAGAFDARDPWALGPHALASLSCLVEGLLIGELEHSEIRDVLRPFLVGPVV
jgi:hypothetical protein